MLQVYTPEQVIVSITDCLHVPCCEGSVTAHRLSQSKLAADDTGYAQRSALRILARRVKAAIECRKHAHLC